jgi:hypothetical protein
MKILSRSRPEHSRMAHFAVAQSMFAGLCTVFSGSAPFMGIGRYGNNIPRHEKCLQPEGVS